MLDKEWSLSHMDRTKLNHVQSTAFPTSHECCRRRSPRSNFAFDQGSEAENVNGHLKEDLSEIRSCIPADLDLHHHSHRT